MALGRQIINTGGAAVACTTDSVQAFGPDNAYSTNLALYQLDGNANDTTGNYNGTASNVTYSTGEFGQAAEFNGSSSNLTFTGLKTNGSPLTVTSFSVSMWVNFNSFSSIQNLISNLDGLNYAIGWILNVDINGKIGILTDNNTSVNWLMYKIYEQALSINTWYNLVLVSDGTNNRLYINGNESSTVTYVIGSQVALNANASDLEIGFGGSTRIPNGSIDQVRIFDKAISEEEVATLYAETTSTASNTNPFGEGSGVVLYTLDYDASDAGGLYNGTPTDVEFGVGGQISYGAGFNGSSSKIQLPQTYGAEGETFSYSFWFNTSTNAVQYMISKRNGNNTFLIKIETNGTIALNNWTGSSGPAYNVYSTDSYTDGNWHHFVFTYDGNAVTKSICYIDGIRDTSMDWTYDLLTQSIANGNVIGQFDLGGGAYTGSIDQVRIFNSALNQPQVDILYAETACVYTPTTDIVNYPPGTTPVAYYKLDNTAEDETGTYDGTATNVNYTFGRFSQAAVFNGSSSYINLNSAILPASVFSVSFWVNVNSLVNEWIFSQYTGGVTGRFIFNITSTGGFQINVSSTNSLSTTNIPVITIGNWHHVVVVKDGSNGWTLYADGQPHSTWTSTESIITNQNTILGGDDSVTAYNLDGNLDQVRIYSTVISAGQVTELYNEKPETDTSNFNTVLYEGNSTTNYISNVGYDLDVDNGGDGGLVWLKNRTTVNSHAVFDSVRGATKRLIPNSTGAEAIATTNLTSFDANGFFLGNAGGVNGSGNDYVAWVWKGGGNAVSNTDGSIASTVSANQAAGFSIVKYTGNLTASTVGTGLSNAAELIIVKRTDSTSNWFVYSQPTGNTKYLNLDTAGAAATFNVWNNTSPTSSVFSLAAQGDVNASGGSYISYCFHSVAGYSKIGTYEGLGTSTVTVSDVGFKPSFIIVKNIDASANWGMYDLRRSTVPDRANGLLYPNLTNAEVSNSSTYYFDMNDNGFVVSASNHEQQNLAGRTYLYMVFK